MHSSRMRTARPLTVFPGGSALAGWGSALAGGDLPSWGSALARGDLPWQAGGGGLPWQAGVEGGGGGLCPPGRRGLPKYVFRGVCLIMYLGGSA